MRSHGRLKDFMEGKVEVRGLEDIGSIGYRV